MGDKFESNFTEIFPEFKDSYKESIKTRFTTFLEGVVMNKEPEIDIKKECVQSKDKSSSIES